MASSKGHREHCVPLMVQNPALRFNSSDLLLNWKKRIYKAHYIWTKGANQYGDTVCTEGTQIKIQIIMLSREQCIINPTHIPTKSTQVQCSAASIKEVSTWVDKATSTQIYVEAGFMPSTHHHSRLILFSSHLSTRFIDCLCTPPLSLHIHTLHIIGHIKYNLNHLLMWHPKKTKEINGLPQCSRCTWIICIYQGLPPQALQTY